MAHLNLDDIGDEPVFTVTKGGRDYDIVVDLPLVTVALMLRQSGALADGSIDEATYDKLLRSLYSLFHRRHPDVTMNWIEETFSATEATKLIAFLSSQIQNAGDAGTEDAARPTASGKPARSGKAAASTPASTTPETAPSA